MTDKHLYCSDFPDAPSCCDSCHEDEAMGFEMIELYEDWDGARATICCAVYRHISDHFGGEVMAAQRHAKRIDQ